MRDSRGRIALLRHPLRSLVLLTVLVLAVAAIDLGGSPTPEILRVENPGSARARGRASLILEPKQYLFVGTEFPGFLYRDPARSRDLLGDYHLNLQIFDQSLSLVQRADRPGPYAVVARTIPARGADRRRCKTVVRLPGPVDPAWQPDLDHLDDFARRLGLDPKAVELSRPSLKRIFRRRSFEKLSTDQEFVALVAGIHLLAPSTRWQSDHLARPATAAWRQWWLDLMRKIDGLDLEFPDRFIGPTPIDGTPAPVLRPGSPREAGVRPDAAEAIDAVLRAWAEDTDQAFAVCVARHGVIVLHAAYGERDGQPMTVHTPSWMASVTKPMSGSLMMMLVDRGLVDLDASIDRYLPPLRGIPLQTPLTVRHLYTHVNGLDRFPKWADEMPDLVDRIAIYYPYLRVGRRWSYHGTGYMVGGKIVENVSGEAVPFFYQRHLLGPLGMDETRVSGTHDDARSVPMDIARFGQMLLNRGAYGPWKFFRPETFEAMLPRPLGTLLPSDPDRMHGIGLIQIDEFIGHGARSMATFRIDLDRDLVIVMTRNAMGRNFEKYHPRFLSSVLDSLVD